MPQLYELNLRDYWNIFLKRKLIIIVSFLSVFSAVFIYTAVQTPIYAAYALIKINPYSAIPSEVVFPSRQPSYMIAESSLIDYTKQITSTIVLEAAAREVKLIKEDTGNREKNYIVSRLARDVEAITIERTSMIRLRVYSKDPRLAADLANGITTIFKQMNLEQKNQQAYNVRVFIEKTLADVSRKLKEQDRRMRELTMRGVLGLGVNTVSQINELEKKRGELLTRFTEKYPDVMRIEEQIAELKEDLKSLPKEEFEYSILKRDIAINESLYNSLKQKLPEAQIREAEKVDNVLIVNPAIPSRNPSYPDKKKNYSVGIILGFILAITVALITEHIDTSIGRIEDVENFIKVSVLGVIPFCSRKETEENKGPGKWWRDIFFRKKAIERKLICSAENVFSLEHNTGSVFLEAFRILSVNIQVLVGKGGRIKNKILLVTSCNPEEGKSITTANLGVSMSQMGYKTLVVDADTRRSSVHKIFGLKNKENGLLDILTGKMSADAAIRTATDFMLEMKEADKVIDKPWLNNLNIVTSGTVFPNPVNLFNSDKMDDVLKFFRNRYDVVLIDTSPILAVSEPSILIPKVDGVLLVYKAGAASRIALRRAKIQIESVKQKDSILGVVLNNVKPEIGVDTYYYYNKKYYGEKEKDKKDV